MAKVKSDNSLSDGFAGGGKKVAKVVEYLAVSPNATSSAIVNATGADGGAVLDSRKLVRRAAGKVAHFDQLPSVKSRGGPRKIYKALELIGYDPKVSSAQIATAAGVSAEQVDSIKKLVGKAKVGMA